MDTRADKLIFEENFFNKNLFVENGGTLVGSSLSGGALVTPSGAANYAEFKDVTDIQAFFSGSGVIAFDFTLVESPSGFVAVGWVPHSLDQVVTMSVNSASQLYIEVRVDGVTNNYRVVTGVLELGKKYRIGIASYSASARLYVDGVLVDEDTTLQGQLLGSYPTTTDVTFGGFDATAGRNSAASIIDNIAIYADEWIQLSGNSVGDFLKDYLKTTFTETDIDANTPVWSDLNDKYKKENGIELLADANMEDPDVLDWIPGTASIITKVASDQGGGTQALNISTAGLGHPWAHQIILTIGQTYRVRGYGRGDGVGAPYVYDFTPLTLLWMGTISTDWQYFDFEFVATGTQLRFYGINAVSGASVQFNNVKVELMEISTTNKGTVESGIMGDGIGNKEPVLLEDSNGMAFGTIEYVTFPNIVLDNTKDWSIVYGSNPKDIDTVATHYNMHIGSYTTDGLFVNQFGSTLNFYWSAPSPAGGTLASFFKKGFHTYGLSSNGGIITAYRDGEAVGTLNLSAKPVLNGTYNCEIGHITSSAEADIYTPIFKTFALSARQMREMNQKLLNSIN